MDPVRQRFYQACIQAQPAEVIRMIDGLGQDVNTNLNAGHTPLFYAVKQLDATLVTALLERGALVSTRWSLINLALYEAAATERADSVDALMVIIPMLHQAGAVYDTQDVRGARALVAHGSLRLLHWFFSQGPNPYTMPGLVRFLRDNHVDLNAADAAGKTRLYKAVEQECAESVRELARAGADPNAAGPLGAPLLLAASKGNVEIMRELLNAGANPRARQAYVGTTPLLAAIAGGSLVATMLLLQVGASLDERDAHGYGVLHEAIRARRKDPTIFSVLISLGADVQAVDTTAHDALPPLHYAVRCGCVDAAEELLSHGVPIDSLAPATSMTPLHIACMLGRHMCARMLLDRGANPHLGDNGGTTPLCTAVRSNEVEVVRLFAERRCGITDRNARGETPLHYAASVASPPLIQLLLDAGAEVNAQDNDGWTPLFFACQAANGGAAAELLIERGADVNVQDEKGRTALFIAVGHQQTGTLALLIREGALTQVATHAGLTPRDLAQRFPWSGIVRQLEDAERLYRIP